MGNGVDYTYKERAPQIGRYWWKANETNVHDLVDQVITHIDEHQTYRHAQNLQNMRLYGNLNFLGFAPNTYAQLAGPTSIQNRITLNIVKSLCDTVTSKIGKNKTKPWFLTEKGDESIQNRAKLLTAFCEGVAYQTDFHKKMRRGFRDSTVFDLGVTHVFRDGKEIKVERAFPDELRWDQREAIYGEPRSLYRVKAIPREVLLAKFPKFEAEIMAAETASDTDITPAHYGLSTLVPVREAWHLPSAKGAKDGRHFIGLKNATFVHEDYDYTYFPFIFQRWGDRLLGFGGQSLAEQVTGLQVELNKTLRVIQHSLHLLGIPKVFLEKGSKIVKAHLNNEIGGIVEYSGTMPVVQTFQVVPPQLMEHLVFIREKAYEDSGVSQLSAQSTKPAGLNSGKALREFNDIESERFITVGMDYEDAQMQAFPMFIDLMKEIEKEGDDYEVKSENKKFLKKIRWSDVKLDQSDFIMKKFPVSALSSNPSQRTQDVIDYMQGGLLDKDTGLALLDFPDLQEAISLATAGREDIMAVIEDIQEKGEYTPPEPYQMLDKALPIMQSAYLRAKRNSVPEEKLELFRRWMNEAYAMMKGPQTGAQAQGGAPAQTQGGATGPLPQGAVPQPTAVPTAPPVSDMLPNGPQS